MYKILILDHSEVFCHSLAALLPDDFEAYLSQNGEEFAELLQTIRPDFLVLDMMISGTDGLFVLEAANFAGIRPCVVALTPINSTYIERILEQMQVSFYLRKPCNMQHLAARIADIALDRQLQLTPEMPITDTHKAENFLRYLGFFPHLNGYKMLATAITIVIRNPHISMTKELYPQVAAMWGTDWKQVEHAIRNCIKSAYKQRNDWIWQMYFPCGPDRKVGHLKNSVFISCVADYLRETPASLVASL